MTANSVLLFIYNANYWRKSYKIFEKISLNWFSQEKVTQAILYTKDEKYFDALSEIDPLNSFHLNSLF